MQTHIKTSPAVHSRRQEMKALEALANNRQIEEALVLIASSYGKIVSISQLVLSGEYRGPEYVFFINFADSSDALRAASEMDGLLYGFSALVISIPQAGFSQHS